MELKTEIQRGGSRTFLTLKHTGDQEMPFLVFHFEDPDFLELIFLSTIIAYYIILGMSSLQISCNLQYRKLGCFGGKQ